VNFTTDGLAKGKYLRTFYIREQSIIAIFQCLLTGLKWIYVLSLQSRNFVNKDYDTIYIDTATF
jgi:hypothetical protein